MNHKARDEAELRAIQYVLSERGQEHMRDVAIKTEAFKKELIESSQISDESWRKPMTF